MAALTLDEARRMVSAQHPGWMSNDIDNAARGLVAGSERLALLDQLDAEVTALQHSADQERAEFTAGLENPTDAPLGRVGGHPDPWDAFRDPDREAALWGTLGDSAEREAARIAEQTSKDTRPPGWEY